MSIFNRLIRLDDECAIQADGKRCISTFSLHLSIPDHSFKVYPFQKHAYSISNKMKIPIHSVITSAIFATVAWSHGILTKPYPRAIGPASLAACGPTIQAIIKSDNTSHVEGLPEAGATDSAYNAAKCDLWLCKGLQFEDNVANVVDFKPGEVVNLLVYLRVLHDGYANVSIVDTTKNEVIGEPLITFSDYANENLKTLPANNTNMDVTIPRNLGSRCAAAGSCVLQWFWYGTGAKQTYESCIDFTVAPHHFKASRSWEA